MEKNEENIDDINDICIVDRLCEIFRGKSLHPMLKVNFNK